MAQKQFTTYQEDILSFDLREALLGVARPGRYSGFDTVTADGTPNGTIFLKLGHSANSISILPKNSSTLGSPLGVAITTQGQIIHEDSLIDIDIPDNNGNTAYKWFLIYMEHDYIEIIGDNPATYGVIEGTSSRPALTEPYHRVVLGYIRVNPMGTSISNLTYYPAPATKLFGDDHILQKLFGVDAEQYFGITNDNATIGILPAQGIIGQRVFTEQNYITNGQSLTQSLDLLDQALNDTDDVVGGLVNRKLDDLAAPDDNTDLNASITAHGLLRKLLANSPDYFLRSDGTWAIPPGRKLYPRIIGYQDDWDLSHLNGVTIGQWVTLKIQDVFPSYPYHAEYYELKIVLGLSSNCTNGVTYGLQIRDNNNGSSIIQVDDKYMTGQSGSITRQVGIHAPSNAIKVAFNLNFTNWNQVSWCYISIVSYDSVAEATF